VVPQYAGTPARAAALVGEIDRARRAFCAERSTDAPEECLARTRVHLLGHSQGGLDARYAVGVLDQAAVTASVTTLGTPHQGTPLGDAGLALLGDPRGAGTFVAARAALARLLEEALELDLDGLAPAALADLADAFYWLSEARARAQADGREEAIADAPGVVYRSWAGIATLDGALPEVAACAGRSDFPTGRAARFTGLADAVTFKLIAPVFDAEHRPYDGHIPVASALHGELRGCVAADHLDLIGRPDEQHAKGVAETGFDYRELVRAVGSDLARIE
jgi:hypothetical protein